MGGEDIILDGEGPRPDAVPAGALAVLARAEIDTQVATAHAYPRSIKRFIETARTLATMNPQVAEACLYSVPRAGKTIEGPSVRLAEIVASAWGNLRVGTRVVGQTDKFVEVQAVCHDLERNVAISKDVRRRITDRQGRTFSEDMIAVTANAAASIALRNAVFAVVPMALWRTIYDEARAVAVGEAKTVESKREAAFTYFRKLGVADDRVLARLGREGMADVTIDDIATLAGFKNALHAGDTSVEEVFPPPITEQPQAAAASGSKTSRLAERIAGQRTGNGKGPTPPTPTAPVTADTVGDAAE